MRPREAAGDAPWQQALRPGAHLRLLSGRYEGDVSLPAGARLEGAEGAVVAGNVVLGSGGDAWLSGLRIEGRVRVASGTLHLERVEVVAGEAPDGADGPLPGVTVERGAALVGRRVSLRAARPAPAGLAVGRGARVELTHLEIAGPFRRGIAAESPALLALREARVAGLQAAVHQRGGQLRMEDVTLQGDGDGDADLGLFFSSGSAHLVGVVTRGQASGVLVREAKAFTVRGLRSGGHAQHALAVVHGAVDASGIEVTEGEGIWLLGARATLRDVSVTSLGDALLARHATLTLERARLRSKSDALHLRESRSEVTTVALEADGACLRVVDGELKLTGMQAVACGEAAAILDARARVTGRSLAHTGEADGSPTLVLLRASKVELDEVHLPPRPGAVVADCASGAWLRLGVARGAEGAPAQEPRGDAWSRALPACVELTAEVSGRPASRAP